jgi:hypothetical protein
MQIRGRLMRWAAVGAAVVTVVFGGGGAVGAAASGGFAHSPAGAPRSAGSHSQGPAGLYEVFAGGADLGQMVLGSDQTVQITLTDGQDLGLWITTGTSFAMSFTASDGTDVGCTFSAVVGKKSLSSAKKPGNYTCPGNEVLTWYALKLHLV